MGAALFWLRHLAAKHKTALVVLPEVLTCVIDLTGQINIKIVNY